MFETQIQKWGNSQAVRIPKVVLDMAEIRPEEPLELSVEGGKIIISKVYKKHRTLEERFAGYKGSYKGKEWGTGDDRGAEDLDV